MSKTKKYLMLLAAIGLIATAAGGVGTFATFNAQVTNGGNTFATGSLALSTEANNDVGTLCYSYNGSGNVNGACGAVIATSPAGQEPGGSVFTGTVVVKNEGTLPASTFKLFSPSSTDCVDSQVTALGSLNDTTGNPLCHALVMYVQETAQSGGGTNTYCWYGYSADSNQTCSSDTTTLDSNATNTIADFDTNHTSSAPVELFPLTSNGVHANSGVELAAGASRTFEIGIYLPTAAGNAVQALKSTFGFDWRLDQ